MIEPSTLLQNRYRVSKQIGQGGMGAVYVATDERFRSTVAVKQTFFDDPALRQAFEREAQLLNRLRHTALPRVSDHFTEGNGQFLVMEFIEGADVSELLQKRGGLFPIADVLRWADELLDALDYLHTQEPAVIHRDIKPQNLKLTPRGQIILLDFGLAKGQSEHTRASEMASVFGYSRNYAPLEQIQGTGTDARSDIYSLAATVYHLITGQAPVDALTRVSAVVKNQPDPLRFAHQANTKVPAAVGGILHRAMAINPAQRPRTAAEMRAALRQAGGLNGLNTSHKTSAVVDYTQGQSASTEITVVDGIAGSPDLGQAAPALDAHQRDTTQVRRPTFSQVDATVVDATHIASRRPNRIHVAAASQEPTVQPARKSPAKLLVAAAIVLLVACAAIPFVLTQRSATLPTNSSAGAEKPLDAPASSQPVVPTSTQASGVGAAQSSFPAAEKSSSPSQTSITHTGNEVPTTSAQAAPGKSVATDTANANAISTDNTSQTPTVAGAAGKTGLVIHQSAPAALPANNSNAFVEEELRRAEERRRAQERPQHYPEEPRFPPPGGRYPPPPGGRRPPPPRPRPYP